MRDLYIKNGQVGFTTLYCLSVFHSSNYGSILKSFIYFLYYFVLMISVIPKFEAYAKDGKYPLNYLFVRHENVF